MPETWVKAESCHRGELQNFECTQAKKQSSFHRRLYGTAKDECEAEVQGLIRRLNPPRTPPEHLYVLLDDNGAVKGVLGFSIAFDEDGDPAPVLEVLGRRLDCDDEGIGQQGHDEFWRQLQSELKTCLVEKLTEKPEMITAVTLVHPMNARSKRLLDKNEWVPGGMHSDAKHEVWTRTACLLTQESSRPRA